MRYRTTYNVVSGQCLELCRAAEEIEASDHQHVGLGLTAPDLWTPDGPRDIVTTLWFMTEKSGEDKKEVFVSESSILGPDLTASGPATASAASGPGPAAKSYHIVETPDEIDWINEVSIPTGEYYQALRKDMERDTPKQIRMSSITLSVWKLCWTSR